jgi:hypothetical protein
MCAVRVLLFTNVESRDLVYSVANTLLASYIILEHAV